MTDTVPSVFYAPSDEDGQPAQPETVDVAALRAELAGKVHVPKHQAPIPPPPPVAIPATSDVNHVEYKGGRYEINKAGANSLELIEAMQGENVIEAIKIALTPTAYTAVRKDLKDTETGFTSITAFTEFLEAFAAAVRPTEKQQSS